MKTEVVICYDESGRNAEKAHAFGASEFMGDWLHANEAAIDAMAGRVDYSNPAIKEVSSWICLGILRRLKLQGRLKDK